MPYRWSRFGAAAAVAAMVASGVSVAGSGGSPAGAAAKPMRILLLDSPTTPYTKTNAQTETLMAEAAVTVVNKTGGAGKGHKVILSTADTGGKPTTAVSKLEAALHSSSKPDVVIMGNASPESQAELPILNSAKVLSFNQAPTTTSGKPSKFPYNFDISPGTTSYVLGFVAYCKAHGYKKVAIFHGNDAYGTAIGKSMTSGAKSAGLTVTDNVGFSTTGLTFTATLQGIKATNPQVLWLDGYGAPPSYTLKDVKQLGWTIPMIADDSYSVSPTVIAPPPTGALGTTEEKNLKFETVAAGVYTPPSKTPKNVKTMIAAMKRHGTPASSLLFGYEYDAVMMAAYAARSTHTVTTAAKLAKAIVANGKKKGKKAVPTGLFSSYGYTPSNHAAFVPGSGFSFVSPSKLVTGQFGAPGS